MSEGAKDLMRRQHNIEDFELCELSRKVQCEHQLKQVAEGHVHCECGEQLPQAQNNPRIRDQVKRLAQIRYDSVTSPTFVIKKETKTRAKVREL